MAENIIEQGCGLDNELTMSKKHQPEQDVEDKNAPAPKTEEAGLSPSSEREAEAPFTKEAEESKDAVHKELLETKDRLLRLAADFDNFKKIARREQHNSVNFANKEFILNLLPIVDSLLQAVSLGKNTDESKNEVLIGVEMVAKQLLDLLKKSGVEVFSAQGQPFDPARHEAMGYQNDDNVDEGTAVVEYQKGYLLHGKLLRPARVVVSRKSGNK